MEKRGKEPAARQGAVLRRVQDVATEAAFRRALGFSIGPEMSPIRPICPNPGLYLLCLFAAVLIEMAPGNRTF